MTIIVELLGEGPCVDGRDWLVKQLGSGQDITAKELWDSAPFIHWRTWGACKLYPQKCRQVAEALVQQEQEFEHTPTVGDGVGGGVTNHIWFQLRLAVTEIREHDDTDLSLTYIANAMALRLYGLEAMNNNYDNGLTEKTDETVAQHIAAAIFGDDQPQQGNVLKGVNEWTT